MAVVVLHRDPHTGKTVHKGLSSDPRPTGVVPGSEYIAEDADSREEWDGDSWVTTKVGGRNLVVDYGMAPTSIGNIKATATAPSAGTAVEAFATGARGLEIKNLSTTAAEYLILGQGTSQVNAEANRDAGQYVVRANETAKIKRTPGATHYAWKSASGTPSAFIGQV